MGWLSELLGGRPKKNPVHLDDTNFEEEVLRSPLPVIVDAWSAGCAPCKRLEEVMVNLATEYDGRVKVCELGTHLAPQTALRLRIAATPTVLYFDKGREKERVTGFRGSIYHRETIAEVFGIDARPE